MTHIGLFSQYKCWATEISKSHGISLFGRDPALIPDHNQQLKRRRGNPETGFDPGSDHLQSSQGDSVACFDGVKCERCSCKIISLISLTVKGRVYIQLIVRRHDDCQAAGAYHSLGLVAGRLIF